MIEVLAAFGLAGATGLNAYLPLLIVGLLARYTDLITLQTPWNALENPWVLGVLVVLLVIEMTVDKIPAADTANDIIQTFVRPAAGAILFAASGNVISEMSPVFAMICGLLMASGVHAAKATVRPVITATTGGLGNPVVSVTEDCGLRCYDADRGHSPGPDGAARVGCGGCLCLVHRAPAAQETGYSDIAGRICWSPFSSIRPVRPPQAANRTRRSSAVGRTHPGVFGDRACLPGRRQPKTMPGGVERPDCGA